MPLLEVERLSVSFNQYGRGWRRQATTVLHDVSLDVGSGEIVAVVGSSGSGKSILAHAVLGVLPGNARVSGSIRFDGAELSEASLRRLRGRDIALVPQSVQHLDPLMKVGRQVRHAVPPERGDAAAVQRAIFTRYRLGEETERMYPFQLSGGMARKVLVSTASVSGARLIVADEPTPGLDPTVVKEALGVFRELADAGSAVVLISHDIESALSVADKVAVLYAGATVETAPAADFAGSGETLRHPYTKALWRALPQNEFAPIAGSQPPPGAERTGCAFAPRCPHAGPECREAAPELRELRGGTVRCHYAS